MKSLLLPMDRNMRIKRIFQKYSTVVVRSGDVTLIEIYFVAFPFVLNLFLCSFPPKRTNTPPQTPIQHPLQTAITNLYSFHHWNVPQLRIYYKSEGCSNILPQPK